MPGQHFIQNESKCIGINANVSARIFLKITQPGTKCCKNRFSVRSFLHPSVFVDAFLFILHHCFQLQYRLLQFVRQRSRSTCHVMLFLFCQMQLRPQFSSKLPPKRVPQSTLTCLPSVLVSTSCPGAPRPAARTALGVGQRKPRTKHFAASPARCGCVWASGPQLHENVCLSW